jgi:transposase
LDRRLSEETIAELVAAYRAGTSSPELAERYGLSETGLIKVLRQAGATIRRQPMTEVEIKQAVKLRNEGQSYDEIGRRLGCEWP